jgi:hypothetical protein
MTVHLGTGRIARSGGCPPGRRSLGTKRRKLGIANPDGGPRETGDERRHELRIIGRVPFTETFAGEPPVMSRGLFVDRQGV